MNDGGAADQRRMLADSVADYCRRSDPLRRARVLRDTDPGFDRAAWQAMADLGWTGLVVPEACGGLGLSIAEHAILARGTAALLVPEPLTAAMIATRAIAGCDQGALMTSLLSSVVSGEIIPALAWQESIGDLDPTHLATTASPQPVSDGARRVMLRGAKRFVVGAAGADGYVVSARECGQAALYWVPATTAGIRRVAHRLADGRPVVDLQFDGVELQADKRLALGDVAVRAVATAVDDGNLALAAELLGLSRRLLDVTLDYLRTRTQFGRPIGTFQALQHRAVDLYIHQRIGDAALDQALRTATALADGPPRSAAASRAKARACETARRVTREAVQMHGAIGFTDDCDVGLYVKRTLVLSAWLGNARLHRTRYAALVPLDTAAA